MWLRKQNCMLSMSANTQRRSSVVLMLGQRRRRWTNNKTTIGLLLSCLLGIYSWRSFLSFCKALCSSTTTAVLETRQGHSSVVILDGLAERWPVNDVVVWKRSGVVVVAWQHLPPGCNNHAARGQRSRGAHFRQVSFLREFRPDFKEVETSR